MLMAPCRVKLKHFAKFADMTDALSGTHSPQFGEEAKVILPSLGPRLSSSFSSLAFPYCKRRKAG